MINEKDKRIQELNDKINNDCKHIKDRITNNIVICDIMGEKVDKSHCNRCISYKENKNDKKRNISKDKKS